MKREYMKPAMRVVIIRHKFKILAASSEVRGVSTNFENDDDNFQWGGGGNNSAR